MSGSHCRLHHDLSAPRDVPRGTPERQLGRYTLHEQFASGGMGMIHLGCLHGAAGFRRAVVIKRLHEKYRSNRDLVAMLVHEARLTNRVRHPNTIRLLDVVVDAGEVFLVMEYVHGQALGKLIACAARGAAGIDPGVVSSIGMGILEGLHAAHEATSERGEPLHLVHRDISPQNVLVGADGFARVLDFGIATSDTDLRTDVKRVGTPSGKLGYMAPEHIRGEALDRRADVWGAGVVLWELATQRHLFPAGYCPAEYLRMQQQVPAPSQYADVPPEFDRVVAKALAAERGERWASAREMAVALEEAIAPRSSRAVGAWVEGVAETTLAKRAELVRAVEGADAERSCRQAARVAPSTGAYAGRPPANGRRSSLRRSDLTVSVRRTASAHEPRSGA